MLWHGRSATASGCAAVAQSPCSPTMSDSPLSATEGSMSVERRLIRDLPLPSEVAALATATRRRLQPQQAIAYDEELRLQIHFGGREVVYLRTPEGRVVVGAGEQGEVAKAIASLSAEERSRLGRAFPEVWGWDESGSEDEA
jgi:hypothetical protein